MFVPITYETVNNNSISFSDIEFYEMLNYNKSFQKIQTCQFIHSLAAT